MICSRFSGYTFETLDSMPLDRVIEIYSAAEWLADEERKAIRSKGKQHR